MIKRLAELRRRASWIGVLVALVAGSVVVARTFRAEVSERILEDRERPTYSAAEAADHVGERATVCGPVASTAYLPRVRGQPTFLNLGKPYPDQLFTVVIWDRYRPRFGEPEKRYAGKEICVSGRIEEHEGTPQIEARAPAWIEVCEGLCLREGGDR